MCEGIYKPLVEDDWGGGGGGVSRNVLALGGR